MRVFTQQLDLSGVLPDGAGKTGGGLPYQTGKKTAAAWFTAYLTDIPAGEGERLRPAVIVCPGGGYEHLSLREGEPVAMQYLAMGYHAFVLNYSLAPDIFPTALLELAMLVGRIRSHADEWMVDPEKIVVSGFSAGGHLAASLGVFWNRDFVYGPLGLEAGQIRPDGMILSYPVITAGPECHAGSFQNLLGEQADDPVMRRTVSLELQAGPHTPKTFIWHTVTDQSVPVQNALLFAEALLRHQVSVELHLFPVGCHGLALAAEMSAAGEKRYIEPQCQSWISLAGIWLKHL